MPQLQKTYGLYEFETIREVKLPLKYREDLNFEAYHNHRLFEGLVTEKSMIEYLLYLDSRFQLEYELMKDLKADIMSHSYPLFKQDLATTRQYTILRHVRITFITLYHNREAIESSLTYTLSNGVRKEPTTRLKQLNVAVWVIEILII